MARPDEYVVHDLGAFVTWYCTHWKQHRCGMLINQDSRSLVLVTDRGGPSYGYMTVVISRQAVVKWGHSSPSDLVKLDEGK